MPVINQPNSQIRLTNVSLVRMKRGKKRFEIACYQNKVQDWRSRVEKDLDEVLQIPQVFQNVSKGQVANNEDLVKGFGTTNQDEIILEILEKGEIQLNEKERSANLQQRHNEFLNIISTKCINPRTRKRYPPSIINKTLDELKFHLNPNRATKPQALEAIKTLVQHQIIPIARAQMKIKVILLNRVDHSVLEDAIKPLFDVVETQSSNEKTYDCSGIIDPANYSAIYDVLVGKTAQIERGEGTIEVLDTAASVSET